MSKYALDLQKLHDDPVYEQACFDIMNDLLDDRVEMYGIRNTICWLLDRSFTKEYLLRLHFDEDDIDYVLENPDEDYDLC